MLPKLKSDSMSVFVHKILTLDPKERRILPELTLDPWPSLTSAAAGKMVPILHFIRG